MKNLLEFNGISGNIITCFFYDETSSGLKCFFMRQCGLFTGNNINDKITTIWRNYERVFKN